MPLTEAPTVTMIFLVYNRCEELRISLRKMLDECEYDPALVEVIVVDNASEDGSGDMVAREFPQVNLIRRATNVGISGWNDGFAAATGELVLVFDDDCYLPADGLGKAVAAMRKHDADLVSFSVAAFVDPEYRFDLAYRTGLLSFWGCAVLMRRAVIEEIGGFDPNIFVWGHELEFMLRFYDHGYRHLHLPEITAIHMKDTSRRGHWKEYLGSGAYQLNTRHFAYIAAKHFRARDAAEALIALLAINVRDALKANRAAFAGLKPTISGFFEGMRNRQRVSNRQISRTYRRNFHSFASPWWFSRRPRELLGMVDYNAPPLEQRKPNYFIERPRYYPKTAATLDF
jgi:GT2 family glycosyltransferase